MELIIVLSYGSTGNASLSRTLQWVFGATRKTHDRGSNLHGIGRDDERVKLYEANRWAMQYCMKFRRTRFDYWLARSVQDERMHFSIVSLIIIIKEYQPPALHTHYNMVFYAAAKVAKAVKTGEATISYDKQAQAAANNEDANLNSFDHYVCGERPPVTLAKAVQGKTNEPIPTKEERKEMSTTERIKSGETCRHIAVDNLTTRKQNKADKAFEKQATSSGDLNPVDRIVMGERKLLAIRNGLKGNNDKHIPTPEERQDTSKWERLISGESPMHILEDNPPTLRRKQQGAEKEDWDGRNPRVRLAILFF